MKQVHGITRNLICGVISDIDRTMEPMAEIVLVMAEADWSASKDGEYDRRLSMSTVRFVANEEALRQIAQNLTEWADSLADLGTKTTIASMTSYVPRVIAQTPTQTEPTPQSVP